uniref:Uncharacterized protein n=1 Tax=Meloidogyne incognita TaxID=6306 RepID=A0A914MHS3_MELIC
MLQRTVISGFRQRNHSTATARHRRMLNSHAASQEDLDAGIGSFDYNELIDAQHLQQQMRAAAIATSVHGSGSENYSIHSLEQMPSTYFPIDHPCTIPADGQPHKRLSFHRSHCLIILSLLNFPIVCLCLLNIHWSCNRLSIFRCRLCAFGIHLNCCINVRSIFRVCCSYHYTSRTPCLKK